MLQTYRTIDIYCKNLFVNRLAMIFCQCHLKLNFYQKLLFLHQLTHNMTMDCSLIYKFNTWKLRTRGEHVMYRNCFWHSEHFSNNMFSPCFAKRTVSDKDLHVFGICYFGELEIPVFSDIIPPLSESFRDEKDHNFDTKESIWNFFGRSRSMASPWSIP